MTVDDMLRNTKELADGVRALHKRINNLEDQVLRKQRRAEHWRNLATNLQRELTQLKGKK
jgi:Mg2+ and Co2+ transporter CorA